MAERMDCELVALEEVYELSWTLASKVRRSGYDAEVVVAIARGGFPPARFLCDFLGIPDMACIQVQHYAPGAQQEARARIRFPLGGDVRGLRVLVVDDVNDSGDTFRAALDHLADSGAAAIRTACLHEKTTTVTPADFRAVEVREWHWIIYPWAVMEDVGGFLRRLPSVPSAEEAAQHLEETYGIRLARRQLERVLELLG
jgi:hypoxanthine phosphoribosyltransferase